MVSVTPLQDLDAEEQKSSNSLNCFSTTEQVSSTEEEESPNARKKTKMDTKIRTSLTAKESFSTDSINSHSRKSTPDTAAYTDDSKIVDTESEPEEGEITDTEHEVYSSEDEVTSEETSDSEDSENEGELYLLCMVLLYFSKNPLRKKYRTVWITKKQIKASYLRYLSLKVLYVSCMFLSFHLPCSWN